MKYRVTEGPHAGSVTRIKNRNHAPRMPISPNLENSEHLYSARTTYIYRYHPTENRTPSLKPEILGELKAWQKIERERRGKGGGRVPMCIAWVNRYHYSRQLSQSSIQKRR